MSSVERDIRSVPAYADFYYLIRQFLTTKPSGNFA